MDAPPMFDALGVQLAVGQRVVYSVAGIHATGQLTPGTIASLVLTKRPDGTIRERIGIERSDGRRISIYWTKRILVIREPTSAEQWLRRQLQRLSV
jgi:hypothetical protein